MKEMTLDNTHAWWCESDDDDPEWNQLIEDHGNACGSLIQIDGLVTKDVANLERVVKMVRDLGVTPMFIHVYPEDAECISTLSIFIKENLKNDQRRGRKVKHYIEMLDRYKRNT